MDPNRVTGLVLIALGGVLLLVVSTDVGGEVIVPSIGVGFLVAYVVTRNYGFLIPGAIVTGLGTGVVLASRGSPGETVVLGLGVGFLAIAAIDRLVAPGRPGWWWPFIPGGVLVTTAMSALPGLRGFTGYLLPVALVVIGAALLFRRKTPGPPPPPTSPAARQSQEPPAPPA